MGAEELGEGFSRWMGRWADEVGKGLVLTEQPVLVIQGLYKGRTMNEVHEETI